MEGLLARYFHPDASTLEELQLFLTRLYDEVILKHLPSQVVFELSIATLGRAIDFPHAVLVDCLDTEASGLQPSIDSQLCGESVEHGSTQPSRITRHRLASAAAARGVSSTLCSAALAVLPVTSPA